MRLLRLGDGMRVVARGLDLDGPTRGKLARQRLVLTLWELVRREEAAIGNAGAGVLRIDRATNLGLELMTDLVEQR